MYKAAFNGNGRSETTGLYVCDTENSCFPSSVEDMNVAKWKEYKDNQLNTVVKEIFQNSMSPGIDNSYMYINNADFGATFFWVHVEDVNLYFFNVCYKGWKYCIGVHPEDKYKLDETRRAHYSEEFENCAIAMAHKTFALPVNFLKVPGIRYVELV